MRQLGRVLDDVGIAARHDAAATVVAVVEVVDLEETLAWGACLPRTLSGAVRMMIASSTTE